MAYIYLLVLLLELLAFFNALPNLALLAVDSNLGLIQTSISEGLRFFLLGSLNSIYPICQWIASPLIGGLADKFSRKYIMIAVATTNCIGYLLVGYGTSILSIVIVAIGLAIPALSGGIFPIVKTAISDLSERQNRQSWFNRIALIKAIATIAGPLISLTIMAKNSLVPAFLISSSLSAVSLIIALFFIKDSRRMGNYIKSEKMPEIKLQSIFIFSVFFFLIAGWWSYVKFAPAIFFERYQLDRNFFYYFISALGLGNIITQSILLKFPLRNITPLFFTLALTIGLQAANLPPICMVLLFVPSVFLQGCLIPYSETLISCLGDANKQGKIQGIGQSIESSGRIIGPFLAGIIALENVSFTLILPSIFILVAFFIFQKIQKVEKNT